MFLPEGSSSWLQRYGMSDYPWIISFELFIGLGNHVNVFLESLNNFFSKLALARFADEYVTGVLIRPQIYFLHLFNINMFLGSILLYNILIEQSLKINDSPRKLIGFQLEDVVHILIIVIL